MKFSLIIGTLDRKDELEYCLESLFDQTYTNYEIIIVDQSTDNQTEEMILRQSNPHILYFRSKEKGLSKARNMAIEYASGDYVALIDDDAYYEKDYLLNLSKHIQQHPNSIFVGYLWDRIANKEFVEYAKIPIEKTLSPRQIIRYCPSAITSFPKKMATEIGGFDCLFGVGGTFGAGEETDLFLRAYSKGYHVFYFNDIKAIHPHKKITYSLNNYNSSAKTAKYSYGIGAMYRKQIIIGNVIFVCIPFCEQVVKDCLKLLIRKPNIANKIKFFWKGFCDYNHH